MDAEQIYKLYLKSLSVSTDSRNIDEGTIYFALKGEKFNGNSFVGEAIQNGASYAIVDEDVLPDNNNVIRVQNVLQTLQNVARLHIEVLKRNGTKVIGLTGSNGKTTTKELLALVLSQKYTVAATQGNLNNHIGVPLTILGIKENTEFAIIEMGANHPGEIALLADIAQPDYGVITNIGHAHIEGFKSIEGVKKAKGELFCHIDKNGKSIFVNSSSNHLMDIASDLSVEKIFYGNDSNSFCTGTVVESFPLLKADIILRKDNESFRISTNLFGNYNLENILSVACIGSFFDVPALLIKKGMEDYFPSNHRSQIVKTANNTVIADAYNANPSSMKAAISHFVKMDAGNKMLILGEMRELGDSSSLEHLEILKILEENEMKNVILLGKEFINVNKNSSYKCFETLDQLLEHLKKSSIKNTTVLVKGSRSNKLEKTIECL